MLNTTKKPMSILNQTDTTIGIKGSENKVISVFLKVFLAQKRLTARQLDVTTCLVKIYAGYVQDGVAEPYASTLLFSTDTRKQICKMLNISAAHLNNTFDPLIEKNVLAKEDGKYMLNPSILPSKRLIFNFSIDAN